jgi:hypothetical protein
MQSGGYRAASLMSAAAPAHGVAREVARFAAILAVLLVVHAPALTLPHHWDALNRLHNAHTIAAHHLSPFLPPGMTFLDAQGRPPVLLQLLALTVFLQPYDLPAAHVLWLAFAALAVYMTYRLGRDLWHPGVGVVAAVWLAINPLFFAQSEIIVLEVPLTALTMAAAVCLVERRRLLYLVTASTLVLAKEAGQFALPGLVLFAWWAAPSGKRWRASAFAAAPFCAFVVWMLACQLKYGWLLHPFGAGFVGVAPGTSVEHGLFLSLAYFGTRLLQVAFWDGNWAMTVLALCGLVVIARRRPGVLRIGLASVVAVVVYVGYPAALGMLQSGLQRFANIAVTGASIADVWAQLAQLREEIAVTAGLIVLALPGVRRIDWTDARAWLIGGVIVGYAATFALIRFRMVRYMLPTYPFVFLVGAAALWHSVSGSRSRVALVAAAVAWVFVSHYHGTRAGPGNVLETNLEFREMIAVRRAAATYLEGHASVRVLGSWPETMELRFPYEGYVSQPISIVEDPHVDADVVYVSPQSSDPDLAATLRRAVPGVVLQPLFHVDRGGKSVDLFRIVRPAAQLDTP